MSKTLDAREFRGIIKPGEIFILKEEADPGYDPGPIEYLYTIRNATEIACAIQTDMEIILTEMCEYKEFLGVKEREGRIYEIMMLCYDKAAEKDINYSLYLHRIQTFEENLCEIKRTFGIS